MDDLDARLIAALRQDGRAPLSKLADILSVSRGTVQNRLDRLIASGVILGFTVRVKDMAGAERIRAIMMIEVVGRNTHQVVQSLRKLPEILSLHTTNGAWDLVAEIEVASLIDFDRVLNSIRLIDGIARSETSLLLAPA
ncbi:Lrp/AsnC family transcriptional regulator [Mesorhizobium sp. RMAD-H1]|uniref:Lrp/AsnC family transcriptional regulator n=1 Tax=Mesorhizobium sp. RMAD-H1 TaxID=2587065 RepID=UPI0016181350|nr:Lrp/AsnC family transcriptional regulator [Mesorhizobium sp. RMAD-H1]MBB2972421.1 DNA-binding Lrp family transcriptional regulator [Mesorhizobium sp. RMAD-H1]